MLYENETMSIVCEPGLQPHRVDPFTNLLIPDLFGERAFNVTRLQTDRGTHFSDATKMDGSTCQEQGRCSMLDEKGHTVRTKADCRALVSRGAKWVDYYWCLGLAPGDFGFPSVPLEGSRCDGKAPSFCGRDLICLPQPQPYVCVGEGAASAGRACESPDPSGDFQCVEALFRGTICVTCPADTYQSISQGGSNICISCPSNSGTLGETGMKSVRGCMCKPGFARQQASLGTPAPCKPV